jgi:hypothetical protein
MPDQGFEDAHGLLFDADNDEDLDLYVVSGGNEYNPLTAPYQDRLYLNDGRGNFTHSKESIPVEYASGGCVVPADFDGDGDTVFICRRQSSSGAVSTHTRKLSVVKRRKGEI